MRSNKTLINISSTLIIAISCATIIGAAINSTAHATSGSLKKNSIVTCNGVTYGSHGDGHWHVAEFVFDQWHAVGAPVSTTNPCASSSEPTPFPATPQTTPAQSSPSTINPVAPTTLANPQSSEPQKDSNTAIAEIKINNEVVVPNAEGSYSAVVNINTVDIEVKLASDKATYKIDEMPSDFSVTKPAVLALTVTAEDGTTKDYKITIERKKEDTIFSLWLKNDSEPIEFTNNEYQAQANFSSTDEFHFYYELSPETSSIEITNNGEPVDGMSAKLQDGKNILEFTIKTSYDQEQTYKIYVTKNPFILNLLIMLVKFLVIISISAIIGYFIKYFLRASKKEKSAGFWKYLKKRFSHHGYAKIIIPFLGFSNEKNPSNWLTCYTIFWIIILCISIANFNTYDNPNSIDTLRRNNSSAIIKYPELN